MITLFDSQSGTRYVYDSLTNQILDYTGDACGDDGAYTADFMASLRECGIHPDGKAEIAKEISTETLRRDLDDGWKSLNLSITEECNNRCRYCIYSGDYYYERCHAHRSMGWETVRKAVDLYLEHSARVETKWITFYGGEPLLNWEVIVKTVEYVKVRAPHTHIHISTNGVLLDDEKVDYIISRGISLNISCDGPQELHDAWRVTADGRGTWERLMSVLEMIREKGPAYFASQVRLICTVAPPYDLPRIGAFFEEYPCLKERLFFVGQVDPHDTAFFDTMTPEERSCLEGMKTRAAEENRRDFIRAGQEGRAASHFGRYFYESMLRLIHTRVMNPGPMRRLLGCCFPGEHQVFVSMDEKLYPCQRCGGCRFMEMGTLDRGLDTDAIIGYIEGFIEGCQGHCTGCWCSHLCTHCYITGKKGAEVDRERKEEACEATRRYVRECLEIYTSVLEVRPDAFDYLLEEPQSPEVYDLGNAKCRIV